VNVRKRWLLGLVSGFFFGLSLAIILLGFRVVRLDSAVLTILPFAGALGGVALAVAAPRRTRTRAAAPVEAPDVSQFTGSPVNVPPPPPGEPVPPPAEAPTLSSGTEAPDEPADGRIDTPPPTE
jgi:hypothetical protein